MNHAADVRYLSKELLVISVFLQLNFEIKMKIYIDGEYYDKENAKISVFDHGLLYGDGVFEGIRAYHKRVFKLQEHIERLFYSAKAILLEIPMSQEEICDAVVETCRANQIENGYIRLIVTRGAGSLGLSPDSCPKPGVIIIANTIQLYPREIYENGMEIITAATSRNYVNAVNPA
ncbi:MAG: branched-chain amino acid aminotransferase, partial [Verrucomicrobia bacterium]|nr:branched-chain amino acid aminotransferase [Verrucomicrobiota bacterium]